MNIKLLYGQLGHIFNRYNSYANDRKKLLYLTDSNLQYIHEKSFTVKLRKFLI